MPPFFEALRSGNYHTGLLAAICVLGFIGGTALRLYLANARALRLNKDGRESFASMAHVYRTRFIESLLAYLGTGFILIGVFGALGLLARAMELW